MAARSIAPVNSIRHTLFVLYVAAMVLAFLLPVPTVPIPLPNQFDKMVHFGIFLGFALLLHLDRRPRLGITTSDFWVQGLVIESCEQRQPCQLLEEPRLQSGAAAFAEQATAEASAPIGQPVPSC